MSEKHKVLFFAPFGSWKVHHQLDAFLAASLRARGCEVEVVGCDGLFSTCDVLSWAGSNAEKMCRDCSVKSQALFSAFNLPIRQMRSFLTPHEMEMARTWSRSLDVLDYATATFDGAPIGEWALSSVFSHFRITSSSLHLAEVRKVHQGYLVTTLLTWMSLKRILENFKADAMVVFNARMAAYRVAFDMAQSLGLRVLAHERGTVPGSFTLYENSSGFMPQPVYDFIGWWMKVPLTAEACALFGGMMNSHQGSNANYPGYYNFSTDADGARRLLAIPKGTKVFGAFTSSEFELAGNKTYKSAARQLEYIDQLIDVFRGRSDYLVVRHHPNIMGNATISGDHDFVRRAWKQAQGAPPNVRIIMPSEKLASYGLIPHLNGAIAFFSSIVLELIAHGVATATHSEAYCHQAATLVMTDTSTDGLAKLVDQLFERTAAFQPADLRSAYRYLNASRERHSTKFEVVEIKNFFEADIRFQDSSDLLPGRDSMVDGVCEFLTSGTSIFQEPSEQCIQGSTVPEDAFFEEQWTSIQAVRSSLLAADGPVSAPKPVAIVNLGGALNFSEWGARFRYRSLIDRGNIVVSRVAWRDVLVGIRAKLAEIKEPFVLLSGASIEYDESFVTSAVENLEADEAIGGVMVGAWATRGDGMIDCEVFTPRFPCNDFPDACAAVPALHLPHNLLSLGLFRTSTLLDQLSNLPLGMDCAQTAGHLFNDLRGKGFKQLVCPLAMMRTTPLETESSRDTPVLLLIFNRPDLTQQVFEAIRAQRPRKLFVAADGPRQQVSGEAELCGITRQRVLQGVDWDCEVITLLREENLGCKRAVSSAITWFFEHVESGIILEDDCLPDASFFAFCGDLLRRYQDDHSVMQIGGVNFQQGRWRGDGSWYFSKYAHIWGWATWRRAWQTYDLTMAALDEFLESERSTALWKDPREVAYWTTAFKNVRDGKIDTWDYQWTFAIWKNGGKIALPQANLITNIGFRSDGTHTIDSATNSSYMPRRSLGELEAPSDAHCNEVADDYTFNTVFSPPKASSGKKGSLSQPASSKGGRVVNRSDRALAELAELKSGLAWRLVGKHCNSIEKRLRRLFSAR